MQPNPPPPPKTMKHPKLRTQPRQLFSCGFFGQCTQTVLSPTTPTPPSPPQISPPPPPPPPLPNTHRPPQKSHHLAESSSSSSSSTSQSFTQWRFPVTNSPHHQQPGSDSNLDPTLPPNSPPMPPPSAAYLQELFHLAEIELYTGSESEQLSALFLLERSLVPNPPADPVCSPELMKRVVVKLKNKAGVKSATKILLALCLAGQNRHVAVEAGMVGTVVEGVMEMEGAAAERALAALELTCTVAEGAAELRSHALAVPVMVTMMGKMSGRGREYAISALAIVYGGGSGGIGSESEEHFQHAPPEEVARAVVLALEGDCTARGKRKGTQLLKSLKEYGRVDLTIEGTDERP